MNKLLMPLVLLPFCLLLSACDSEDTYKMPDSKDSAAGASKKDSAAAVSSGTPSNHATGADSTARTQVQPKGIADNSKQKPPVKTVKKKVQATDSTLGTSDGNSPVAQKSKLAAADNTKTAIDVSAVNAKPFVSKYGTIPRNATTDNITEFRIAFTDKATLIKIYFNADPDNEMQTVKTQVINVLKKSGYTNISDQSLTLHPMHIPKDIHYELQHDGSVVIWIPPASTE